MTTKQKFEQIDQSKLEDSPKKFLETIKKKTNNFEDEEIVKKTKADLAIDAFIKKYPEALKSKPAKPKTKAKTTKPKKKKPTPKKASSGAKRRTIATVAKEIRRADESWNEAMSRAKEVFAKEREKKQSVVKSELKKLDDLIKNDKVLKSFKRGSTTISKDAKIQAKPRGKRISKNGKTYYENRENRSDRFAPSFPKGKPFLEQGGDLQQLNIANADLFAKGGEVMFTDLSDSSLSRKIWESRKSKTTGQNSFGAFAHKLDNKYVGDYYLYRLSDFDEDYYSHIVLKDGEILARQETDNMLFNEMPLVKINIKNGRVYFLSEDNDPNDDKNIKFNRSSADVIYLSLDNAIKNYAKKKGVYAKGGFIAKYNGKSLDIQADSLYEAKKKAIKELKVPKSKQGLLAIMSQQAYDNKDFMFMAKGGQTRSKRSINTDRARLSQEPWEQDYLPKRKGSYYEKGGSTNTDVAETILNQLGGMRKLSMFTGAKNFVALPNGVSFKIGNRSTNYVKITLNGKDLYDMEFALLRGSKTTNLREFNDIYNDQLINIFEQQTGMYLSFAEGGLLEAHGLMEGDTIMSKFEEGYQKVKDKDGSIVYVNLSNGYRGVEPPLPFEQGGEVSPIIADSIVEYQNYYLEEGGQIDMNL